MNAQFIKETTPVGIYIRSSAVIDLNNFTISHSLHEYLQPFFIFRNVIP